MNLANNKSTAKIHTRPGCLLECCLFFCHDHSSFSFCLSGYSVTTICEREAKQGLETANIYIILAFYQDCWYQKYSALKSAFYPSMCTFKVGKYWGLGMPITHTFKPYLLYTSARTVAHMSRLLLRCSMNTSLYIFWLFYQCNYIFLESDRHTSY